MSDMVKEIVEKSFLTAVTGSIAEVEIAVRNDWGFSNYLCPLLRNLILEENPDALHISRQIEGYVEKIVESYCPWVCSAEEEDYILSDYREVFGFFASIDNASFARTLAAHGTFGTSAGDEVFGIKVFDTAINANKARLQVLRDMLKDYKNNTFAFPEE